ncbi:MAG: cation transporting ATPase C-terminal domain-containing protein [Cyanobacteria bacterium SZAS TMP-1]|nr:cation transporting ATPase C-terminal domain-containing protein [Cyanobacteria bacterium SZAS TMP-1]
MLIDLRYLSPDSATTVALSTLSLSLILQSWSWLSADRKAPGTSWQVSVPMLVCTGLNLVLLGMAIYFPPFQFVLNTNALDAQHAYLVTVPRS